MFCCKEFGLQGVDSSCQDPTPTLIPHFWLKVCLHWSPWQCPLEKVRLQLGTMLSELLGLSRMIPGVLGCRVPDDVSALSSVSVW